MRYLIVSDIHANWEALRAVLDHARGSYDEILCLGDIVGYGADPNATTDWARGNVKAVIRGNHDKACTGSEDVEWFNPAARVAAEWTLRTLTPKNLEYLQSLPKGPLLVGAFQILHGSPLDEDDYLVGLADAAQLAGYLETDVSFFGHTHLQGGFRLHRNGIRPIDRPYLGEERLEMEMQKDLTYLINPGSVGQPRDGDPRAGYVLYEPETRLVSYCRASYDIEAAQRKIVNSGLPEMLAWRLARGS